MIKKKGDNGKSKFADAIAELDQEARQPETRSKAAAIIKQVAEDGGDVGGTKAVYDKDGKFLRRIKIKEPRKSIPVYLPESLYAEFDRITSGRGVSKNAEINRMVREYVADADK